MKLMLAGRPRQPDTATMQIRYLDGPRLRRSLVAACEHAQRQRGELNRINVFPVPDGDTGTNLALTVRAIADHLRGNRDRGVSGVAQEAAQAAVLGARGNCGMMLSHFLLGFAERMQDRARITTREFGEALSAGVRKLHEALEVPIEGTILTVMRDTALAAGQSDASDFVPFFQDLVEKARASLARTPDLLPVLRKAGVVDAGAKGFVSLLEGVLLLLRGDPALVSKNGAGAHEPVELHELGTGPLASVHGAEQYRFCTEALVRGARLPVRSAVQSELRDHGDSLIVIRTADVLKVHVHTDEPERVFAYLRGLGTLVTHKAEDMRAQHEVAERALERHASQIRRPVSIMTDSAADLPEEIIRAHGIHVTPLLMVDGGRTYRDGVDISAREFHARLSGGGDLPTTSQPAPAHFLETFGRAADEGESVVGVILGSSLSGTLRSAEAAAGRFDGAPVHLVDSCGASLLQGLLVLKACELAELGRSPAQIVEELVRVRRRSGLLFTLDTFDRLLASGRVGRGAAALGSMLSVKPLLRLDENGAVVPVGKVIGRDRARVALLDELTRRAPPGRVQVRFGIVHVGRPEVVDQVTKELADRYGPDVEILAAPATPVLATHLGLGAWGVAYLVDEEG